jgi:signal transduction histidine kinase
MTNGLVIYDDQNKIITANQRFKDLFEFPDELVKTGVHLEDLLRFRGNRGDFGNLSIEEAIQEKTKILADRQFHRTEEETTDGHWVEIFRSPTANNGSIVIINDITERRQTEIALERLNIEKDKFFTIIAHDLRGPFASLVGVTELLANRSDGLPKAEISLLHQSLYESGKNLFALLENLFEWAELQRGVAPFNLLTLELKPILASNLMLYRSFALEKNIHLGVVNIPNKPILADPNMIDTVLRNLLQNAIKFTHLGGNIIIPVYTDHEWMWVKITDTGIGISKERIESIFKLDTTLSTIGTKGEVGSGLGLHVCNELVKKCGGILKVTSQEGDGTTFKFSIPLA